MALLLKLPAELFEMVAKLLDSDDYASLAKTSRALNNAFNPRLYHENDRRLRDAQDAIYGVHDPAGDENVSVNYTRAQNGHALCWAAANGRYETFVRAAALGVDVFRAGFLQRAAAHGQTDIVTSLLEGKPSLVNEQADFFSHPSYHGFSTALHAAAARKHICVVFALVSRGADVNAVAADPCFLDSPLHRAVAHGGDAHIVNLLLVRGANPAAVNAMGRTPLHRAVANCDITIALDLLNHGARTNPARHAPARALRGAPPRQRALRPGHPAELPLIPLQYEPTPTFKGPPGTHRAAPRRVAAKPRLVRMLIDRGASLISRSSAQWVPIAMLARYYHVKLTNAVDLEQGGVLTLDTTVGEMIDGLRLFS
ncbi:hypothetical protein ACCO45_006052 [Purpureocillium lilacinum]|uniref:Uncharacterized protein n=1 Tax=Purpureocillium lilacinum TaxID=33203 RepID=A0ACC4DZY4_PURLI